MYECQSICPFPISINRDAENAVYNFIFISCSFSSFLCCFVLLRLGNETERSSSKNKKTKHTHTYTKQNISRFFHSISMGFFSYFLRQWRAFSTQQLVKHVLYFILTFLLLHIFIPFFAFPLSFAPGDEYVALLFKQNSVRIWWSCAK